MSIKGGSITQVFMYIKSSVSCTVCFRFEYSLQGLQKKMVCAVRNLHSDLYFCATCCIFKGMIQFALLL